MKMIVHCCFFTVLSLALAGCANRPGAHAGSTRPGSPSDPFRINVHLGDSGQDVYNWQDFLKRKHFGLKDGYPNGRFDPATKEATMRLQASYIHPTDKDYGIAITGEVNWATYYRALEKGMTAYPPVPPHKMHTKNYGDYFRIVMRIGDNDVTPNAPNGVHFNDVHDWQNFLISVGYLGAGYPTGTFGSTTVTATNLWQHDAKVGTLMWGKVDLPTYNMAKTWGMDNTYIVVQHP